MKSGCSALLTGVNSYKYNSIYAITDVIGYSIRRRGRLDCLQGGVSADTRCSLCRVISRPHMTRIPWVFEALRPTAA